MKTVEATFLKNRLGSVLADAALGPVAIRRHGRIVAYLVPEVYKPSAQSVGKKRSLNWTRESEERAIELCSSQDLRPSRWLRAGDTRTLAGIAVMMASEPEFDRKRMLALATRLDSTMTSAAGFNRWLSETPVIAARLLPMIRSRMSFYRTSKIG